MESSDSPDVWRIQVLNEEAEPATEEVFPSSDYEAFVRRVRDIRSRSPQTSIRVYRSAGGTPAQHDEIISALGLEPT